MYNPFGKRVLDIACSATALLALSPILLLTSALIWLEDRHSPIFKQIRLGKNQTQFVILKLRSMPTGTAEFSSRDLGQPVATRMGRIIRRLNVDELPQLINILTGDMSLVGPRPALHSQSELVALRESHGVFSVAPGLTGLAQVESYDDMPETEKVKFDARYAENVTLLGDFKIIVRTFTYLLKPPPKY